MTTISPSQLQALKALSSVSDEWFLPFAAIKDRSGLPEHMIRRSVRALARKGLAQYGKGLWSDDGTPAGAGYGITKAGRDHLAKQGVAQ